MFTQDELNFYSRHLLLEDIGEAGQSALKQARVLVVGTGGLGCPVLIYLTGAGVGTIGIVDGDAVQISNLNRQTLFGHSQLGNLKTSAAIDRLRDINPYIRFKAFSTLLTAANALEIIKEFDIVVDATDNFASRYLINDACLTLDKPFVFASIDKFQGQISVFNFENGNGIKGPTYRCLFPNPPTPETAPNCSEIGVMGVLPGVIGSLQANEVIKIITGLGNVLSGKLLMIDLLKNTFMDFRVNRDEQASKNIFNLRNGINNSIYSDFCNNPSSSTIRNISRNEINNSVGKYLMIDVREKHDNAAIDNSVWIPASKLKSKIDTIDKKKPVVLFCDYGITSQKAAAELVKFGFYDVYNLQGGLQRWNLSG